MNEQKVREFISVSHEQIDGWFFGLDQITFFELFVMQKSMRISGDMCEIGVFRGKSLALLSLLKTHGETLFGFDLFDGEDQEITRKNLSDFGCSDDLRLVKGLTSDLSESELDALISKQLRFLHIDAGHEYHEVLEQLILFSPYLSNQAIIAMDDYQDREFPGIETAVLDFSDQDRPRRFVPFLAGGNKMFLCHPIFAPIFQSFLLQRQNFMDRCRMTRVRDFNVLVLQSKLPVPTEKVLAQLQNNMFPARVEGEGSLNQKALRYSQLTFGSGDV